MVLTHQAPVDISALIVTIRPHDLFAVLSMAFMDTRGLALNLLHIVLDFRRPAFAGATFITETVRSAAEKTAEGDFAVVVGHEDFWGGFTSGELCLPQARLFDFFANAMRALSSRYPLVLIIPGSAYAYSDASEEDTATYLQDGVKIAKALYYVQNIIPVFYGGEWLRMIKKGDYLQQQRPTFGRKQSVLSIPVVGEIQFICALAEPSTRFLVKEYGEGALDDILGMVFMGYTPLPGERALLVRYGVSYPDFFNQKVSIRDQIIGIEICRDHQVASGSPERTLKDLTLHILSSDGKTPEYDGTDGRGLFIRADRSSSGILRSKSRSASSSLLSFLADDYEELPSEKPLHFWGEETDLSLSLGAFSALG